MLLRMKAHPARKPLIPANSAASDIGLMIRSFLSVGLIAYETATTKTETDTAMLSRARMPS
jgi:hypothetical protein